MIGGISKRDINLLLTVFGLLITLAVYFLVFSRLTAAADALDAGTEALRPRLATLQAYLAELPEYEAGIRDRSALISSELAGYARQVRTEDLIMYAVMLESEAALDIASATFAEPVPVSEFSAPGADGAAVAYRAYSVSMTLNSQMTYAALKDAIDIINATPDRTLLDSLSVTFDSVRGGLIGTVTLSKVFITDGSYVYAPTVVPDGAYGNGNPFGTVMSR
ncbi:MAG: hypothetical protein LBN99_01850 [Oscillospiraceae bacterium]|nr:hypothetical protein [Oscillospiraceae bacterium]